MADLMDSGISACDSASCEGCSGCDPDNGFNINENGATVTLNLDDGTELNCAVIAIFPCGGKEYTALLPLNENGENEDGEVFLYRFFLANGEPALDNIEDDAEYQAAAEAFDEWLSQHEYDDLVYEDTEASSDASSDAE